MLSRQFQDWECVLPDWHIQPPRTEKPYRWIRPLYTCTPTRILELEEKDIESLIIRGPGVVCVSRVTCSLQASGAVYATLCFRRRPEA